MKTNKVTKLGISLLSVAALGVVAPALTDNPVFGASIVKAEEQQKPLKYRIDYIGELGEKVAPSEFGVLNPGETINIYKDIEGHEVVSRFEWLPSYNMDYDTLSTYSGFTDGYNYMYLKYKKLDPTPAPSPTPKPEVTPETKPSETPKPEVKPETNPSETPKPEVKPETKPSETPKPEVKPETKPSETSKPEVKPETNPSETPKPEVKPETKPSETPKPEVKPETNPSETPKPGVKPETKPQTNSNTAPQAPVKPVGQDSNTKADKPVSKPETTALPNTGEQNSILGFAGFLLASLGLAGLTYKGRH